MVDRKTAQYILAGRLPEAEWIWVAGPFGDDRVSWKCRKCGRSETHQVGLIEAHWITDPVSIIKKIARTFMTHACEEDLRLAVDLLVQIILHCGHAWFESLDDSIKRFALLEFK